MFKKRGAFVGGCKMMWVVLAVLVVWIICGFLGSFL